MADTDEKSQIYILIECGKKAGTWIIWEKIANKLSSTLKDIVDAALKRGPTGSVIAEQQLCHIGDKAGNKYVWIEIIKTGALSFAKMKEVGEKMNERTVWLAIVNSGKLSVDEKIAIGVALSVDEKIAIGVAAKSDDVWHTVAQDNFFGLR
jgi:hypothetical protein